MVYKLPRPLPEEIVVSGKSYKRVGGTASVSLGVCKSNDGSWHYYFNKLAVDTAVGGLGNRRHFSVCTATGRRSVHISMKPHAATTTKLAKNDEILIWYRFDDQWTGNRTEPAGWGRTTFTGKDATRVEKAVTLLTAFLETMTAAAEGGKKPAIAKVLTPPVSTFSVKSDEQAEAEFEASQKKPVTTPTPVSSGSTPDSWDEDF